MLQPNESPRPPADPTIGAAAAEQVVKEFNGWLAELVARGGSDLHVKTGAPPKVREAGTLVALERAPLTHEESYRIGRAIVPTERVERLNASGEVDFAYSLPGSVGSA